MRFGESVAGRIWGPPRHDEIQELRSIVDTTELIDVAVNIGLVNVCRLCFCMGVLHLGMRNLFDIPQQITLEAVFFLFQMNH